MSSATHSKTDAELRLHNSIAWARRNSRVFVIGLAAVAATVIGIYLYVRSGQIRSQHAETAYNDSQQLLYQGKSADAKAKMAEVAKTYSGTSAGTMAALRLAVVELDEGRPGPAIAALDQVKSKANKKIFGPSIHGLLAAAYSDSGLYAPAAGAYLEAASSSQLEAEKADFNFRAAEMYALAGNKDRAIELLRTVAEGTEPGETRGKALKLLGELTAAPAKVGGPA
jgi:hypothetical protein